MDEKSKGDDVRLLERCAGGDDDALAALYETHASLARRMAWRVLRDPDLADDAVQEAFLDVWRMAAKFDPRRAAVTTWICLLVHRRAVDIARREARRRLADEGPLTVDPASYTAEEIVLLRYEQRRVRVALTGLSDPHREVVELAYYGGLTQTHIAERLGVPLGTVKSRMFDALRRLGVVLAPAAVLE